MPDPLHIAASRETRARILAALYDARRANLRAPRLMVRELEQLAGGTIDFDLAYLVERRLVTRDGFWVEITAPGIDAVEEAACK